MFYAKTHIDASCMFQENTQKNTFYLIFQCFQPKRLINCVSPLLMLFSMFRSESLAIACSVSGFNVTLTKTIKVWHSIHDWVRERPSDSDVVPKGFRVEAFGACGRLGINRKKTKKGFWQWKAFPMEVPQFPTERSWQVVSSPV
jgi:hypothetical protein